MVEGGGGSWESTVGKGWGSKSWGSSVASTVDGWGSNGSGVGTLDDWSSAGNLDDVLSSDWVWFVDWVWLSDVVWGWDLDDLLNVLVDIVWGWVWLLDWEWLVDNVWLSDFLDDWSGDLLGSLQGSWDSDVDVSDVWLHDLGVVSSDVSLGAVVNLLGDLLWGLGVADSWGSGNMAGGVWSWDADGSWGSVDGWSSSIGQWSSSNSWGSSIGQWSSSDAWGTSIAQWSDVSWGSAGGGNHDG